MKKSLAFLFVFLLLIGTMAFANGTQEADRGYDIYVYNSKGENATQFAAMCAAYEKETGVRVKNFSIGSGQDHMETLRSEMNSKDMPTVFSVQGIKELAEWTQGGFALDLNTVKTGDFGKMAKAIPQSLRLTTDGITSYGVPYNVEGYGYIVDKQLLGEFFGSDKIDAVISDIKAASYDEWANLIKTTDAWIKAPSALSVTLNGKTYTFATKKGTLSANLNGVFSVMGSEKWTYGDHFINIALNAVFTSELDANKADNAKVESAKGALLDYAKALDLKTSYLAGLKGPAERGQDFVSSANFGYDQAIQIFAENKAVFLKQGNWAFGNIQNLNADMAKRLVFLPVKMPFKPEDIKRTDGMTVAKLNSSIPVFVPNYYAINALASDADKQKAEAFLYWLNNSTTGKHYLVDEFAFIPYNADPKTTTVPNSLGNSIISYIDSGNILGAPYNGSPASWSGDVVGLKLKESYLTKKTWTEADYNDIANYAIQKWIEMKN
ncbi:extracellular solute-binding protein [uncultured Sphaerochaeta sp.]|uniref:extracellular solute-binding protein n=1 Tax=uncultured Sphaerochaeta sp. TaxID=886478 RepID=UPI002A0A7E96|nr:extracellular solute-binding protein [uncultured Sphaerochaeta sp.]